MWGDFAFSMPSTFPFVMCARLQCPGWCRPPQRCQKDPLDPNVVECNWRKLLKLPLACKQSESVPRLVGVVAACWKHAFERTYNAMRNRGLGDSTRRASITKRPWNKCHMSGIVLKMCFLEVLRRLATGSARRLRQEALPDLARGEMTLALLHCYGCIKLTDLIWCLDDKPVLTSIAWLALD